MWYSLAISLGTGETERPARLFSGGLLLHRHMMWYSLGLAWELGIIEKPSRLFCEGLFIYYTDTRCGTVWLLAWEFGYRQLLWYSLAISLGSGENREAS